MYTPLTQDEALCRDEIRDLVLECLREFEALNRAMLSSESVLVTPWHPDQRVCNDNEGCVFFRIGWPANFANPSKNRGIVCAWKHKLDQKFEYDLSQVPALEQRVWRYINKRLIEEGG